MTVVPVDRLPPGAQGSRQVGSSGTQVGSGDLGKEVGTLERGGKGNFGEGGMELKRPISMHSQVSAGVGVQLALLSTK